MRKVMILKRVETKSNLQDDCEATFHQWGSTSIEGPNGCFTGDAIAVCEKADGTVVTPYPTMIRFLDKMDAETCKWMRYISEHEPKGNRILNPHNGRHYSDARDVCDVCRKRIEVIR